MTSTSRWLGRMDDSVCRVLSTALTTEDKIMEPLSWAEPQSWRSWQTPGTQEIVATGPHKMIFRIGLISNPLIVKAEAVRTAAT